MHSCISWTRSILALGSSTSFLYLVFSYCYVVENQEYGMRRWVKGKKKKNCRNEISSITWERTRMFLCIPWCNIVGYQPPLRCCYTMAGGTCCHLKPLLGNGVYVSMCEYRWNGGKAREKLLKIYKVENV